MMMIMMNYDNDDDTDNDDNGTSHDLCTGLVLCCMLVCFRIGLSIVA